MDRRRLRSVLACGATVAALSAVALAPAGPAGATGSAGTPVTQARAQQIGTDAYVYGIALMEFERQARTQTSVTVPNSLSDAPVNQLGSARQLATVSHQVFVQPNLDTLYSMAHCNLTGGALVLHVPAVSGHRYYSFEFLDPYTNVFDYVGTRTTGDGAGTFVITGPSFHGRLPKGLPRIRATYQHIWIVGRTLVKDAADLPAVHRVQNGYRLLPLREYVKHGLNWRRARPHKLVTTHTTATVPTGMAFYDQLGTALAQNPPPERDATMLRELHAVGIGPGLHPSTENLSPAVRAGLLAAVQGGPAEVFTLRETIAAQSIGIHDGWFVPHSDTGSYGVDYDLRAVIAVNGLAANRPAEAMYIVGAVDNTHALINGSHDYVIHFAAGHLPPARYFWSLTMYDQSFYLVPNSINRYALGNRTRGLKYNSDGSLDIYLQHTPPAGHTSNWLPAPTGSFEVTLRMYGPRASALHGTYVYPPITRTG